MPFRYELAEPNELRQGEILGPVTEYRTGNPGAIAGGNAVPPVVEPHPHTLVIVATADCDLLKDFRNRQPGAVPKASDEVGHILICDLYKRDEIANLTPAHFGTKERKRINQNQDERYHCFPAADIGASGRQLEELFLDFKRSFSLPTSQIYEQIALGQVVRVARVPSVFLQDLMHRMYGFLSRVGPEFD